MPEPKGVNRTFCLFPPAPPPPSSLPALYHCRAAARRGAGEVEGRRGFLRRPGLPAAAGPLLTARRGRGVRGPPSAQPREGARAVRGVRECPRASRLRACLWVGAGLGRREGKAGGQSGSARRSPAGMRHGRGVREDAVAV